ncbi:MAG: hypothetical protein JW822_05935 [Spirochaetales bacterium]|nr:hypothetical protein [Spirochaetales bacterium]
MFHFKLVSILCVIALIFLFTGACSLDTSEKGIHADDEAVRRIRSTQRYYTPKGTLLPTSHGPINCHAFAWQYNCGVPSVDDIPGYYLASPSAFWFDGSFKLIAEGNSNNPIPVNVQVGDKVTYSTDAHSAIVYSTNPNNPLFISYTIGSPRARIHHPNDPGGSFGGALRFYHVARSDYCTTSPHNPPPIPPPKLRFLQDGLLFVEVAEGDYRYYARMLNSNDEWRFIWCLSFDTPNGWWERRETASYTSQDTGVYFYRVFPSATKMTVYLYAQNIYGRGCYMIRDVRYK